MQALVRYWDARHGFWRVGIVIKEGYKWVIVRDLSTRAKQRRVACADVVEVKQ